MVDFGAVVLEPALSVLKKITNIQLTPKMKNIQCSDLSGSRSRSPRLSLIFRRDFLKRSFLTGGAGLPSFMSAIPLKNVAWALLLMMGLGAATQPVSSEVLTVEPKYLYAITDGRFFDRWYDSAEDAFAQVQSEYAAMPAPGPGCRKPQALNLHDAQGGVEGKPTVYRWDVLRDRYPVYPVPMCVNNDAINTGTISMQAKCDPDFTMAFKAGFDGKTYAYCYKYIPDPPVDCEDGCGGLGNPVFLEARAKSQIEVDFSGPSGLRFSRTYSSLKKGFLGQYESRVHSGPVMTAPGGCVPGTWVDNDGSRRPYCFPILITDNKVRLSKPGLSRETAFDGTTLARVTSDVRDTLSKITDAGGAHIGWKVNRANGKVESYSVSGRLNEIQLPSGQKQTLSYTGDKLAAVTDHFGRSITFSYYPDGRLSEMTDPVGGLYSYTYDSKGNLSSVTYPDSKQRIYHYEHPTLLHALTGITDENNVRYSTYGYNNSGWATSTEYAGGVNKFTFEYINSVQVKVTDPLTTEWTYLLQEVQGSPRISSIAKPCSLPGCTGTVTQQSSFDANGNTIARKDFNGNRTCFKFDLARNLETARAEGMGTVACPANLDTWTPAANTLQRKISTELHPTWRAPSKVASPNRLTTTSYHGDPGFNCSPVTSAVQLVCQVKVEATTDDSGAQGLSPTLDAGTQARIWTWTYNADGQVVSAKDPANNIATYTYYEATDVSQAPPKYRRGDLKWIEAPDLGGTVGKLRTEFLEYDPAGRLKMMKDPNGLETSYTYWPRGWLQSSTVGSSTQSPEVTFYEYDGVGQLSKVTRPDGSYLSYFHDNARRLWKVVDSQGNKTVYELNAKGDRTKTIVFDEANNYLDTVAYGPDASGNIVNGPMNNVAARIAVSVFDSLGRLKMAKASTSPVPQTQYVYDDQDNLKTVQDPLGRVTTNEYDALNRLKKTTDAQASPAGETLYSYDGQDRIKSVTDPRGTLTTYEYNGFGELKKLTSADTGETIHTYDAAGNLATKTDARGVVLTYTYDALNRVKTQSSPAVPSSGLPAELITYTYDTCTNGLGRLCKIVDMSGETAYVYDIKGRIKEKAQKVYAVGATPERTFTVKYGYDAGGRLATVTLPSNEVLTYGYNAIRQVASVSVTPVGGAAQTIMSGAGYEPFGPIAGWTWGNGTKSFLDYDLDGRMTQYEQQAANATSLIKRTVGWNVASQVVSLADLLSGLPASEATYDEVSRLKTFRNYSAVNSYTNFTYNYDKNGNRTGKHMDLVTSGNTAPGYTSYAIASNSNRLNMVGQAGADFPVTYDGAGNTSAYQGATYTYNQSNRLIAVNGGATAQYRLNALGQRVLKVTAQGSVYFVYDEQGRLLGEYDPGTASATRLREHVWVNDRPVAVLK